ncbi:PspC domain-containing protein [Parasediminibacterium sp. JCM 36343]|uniref:PspC domain-containing protein n=1 Tax=Parasediminibacterium sp. JCM 36343 TaxID=3374279 RepID=UPI00397C7C32
MKKVININFQGRVVPIEENAYDILKQYVESLRRYFAEEEGRDEIINDIESRVAELFAETLKKGSTCITDDDVNNIINSMGRPEDFDDEEANVHAQLGGKQQSYQQQPNNNGPRRFLRDENNKVLGGVCSGIANYLGIDPLVVRILAGIMVSLCFVPYLVIWVAVPSTAAAVIGSTRKRLFRDMDDKVIGGVASGLSHYFGINVWIPRLIFLIPFLSFITNWNHGSLFHFQHFLSLSFSPGATVIYIILWLILPEALTSADKLEMKGERVDLNSIKNTIQTDMEGFKERAEKFGADLKNRAEEFGKGFAPRAQQYGNEAAFMARRSGRGLGGVIAMIAKIFAYFILSVLLLTLTGVLFGFGIVFIGFSPVFDYVFNSGSETALAWASIVFFIWVPVIGIITWVIRRFMRTKRNSGLMRYTFISLWAVGWVCAICLLASLDRDFKYKNSAVEENVRLSNPKIDKLEVQLSGYGRNGRGNHWMKFEPFEGIDSDTVFVPNTDIRVTKSNSDSFEVTVVKMSNGESRAAANALANKITYSIAQKDSILSLYKGIPINTTDKFRNQRMIITIAVPVGKRIKIDDKIGWRNNVHIGINDNDWDWKHDFFNEQDMDWQTDVEYIMTVKGLKSVKKSEDNDNNNDDKNQSLEDYKRSREELKQDIEEQQRQIDEKKKELQDQIKDQQKELEEKKRELKRTVDSTLLKSIYQLKPLPRQQKLYYKGREVKVVTRIMNTI